MFVDAQGNEYQPYRWLTFNDVLLKPQRSPFKSRNDKSIILSSLLSANLRIDIPIISSNMDTITGVDMAIEMNRLGGLGILHRFYPTLDDYFAKIVDVYERSNEGLCKQKRVAFSIGCGSQWIDFVRLIIERVSPEFPHEIIVCLDVAHGHMEQSVEMVEKLQEFNSIHIIAGNVATSEACLDLAKAGAHVIKVGIGPGSVCSTRTVTGHGVPQLSAIMSCYKAISECKQTLQENNFHIGLIADGGIKTSGDIVKALAAGADAVMIGNLFSGTDETPGETFKTKDGSYKIYRGQSSRHFLNDIGKVGVSPEGESLSVAVKGPVKNIINELVGGIKSGLTYSGAGDIYELREKAQFIEITTNGWTESIPHALLKA